MIKLKNGIYRFDGELLGSQKPLVLVHPWFEIESGVRYQSWGGSGDYLENLNSLLKESEKREIFLFEEAPKSKVLESCNKLAELRGTKGLYAIVTVRKGMLLIGANTKKVFDYIANRSHEVDVAGGFLWRRELSFDGCAGHAYIQLRASGTKAKLVKKCCFKNIVLENLLI